MKILNSIIAIILLLFSAFSQKPVSDYSEVEKEINNLASFEVKKSYLEEIYRDDQRVRDAQKSTDLINKYGRDSKEYRSYGQAMRQQDVINLA